MAEQQDFQVIISSQDYHKLSAKYTDNESCKKENEELRKQVQKFKQQLKDMKKSVYIRDSYIQYLTNEFLQLFGSLLNIDIISNDNIMKSFYQQIVTHEQNGISSIEMRAAMDLFIEQNAKIFEQMQQVYTMLKSQKQTISSLEKQLKSQKQISNSKVEITHTQPRKQEKPSVIKKQHENLATLVSNWKKQLLVIEQEKIRLHEQIKRLDKKRGQLTKENEKNQKKRENQGEKSYVLKLMVDEYYRELQKNLLSLGGLTQQEIRTVVGNQMKGIIHYIETLTRKARIK